MYNVRARTQESDSTALCLYSLTSVFFLLGQSSAALSGTFTRLRLARALSKPQDGSFLRLTDGVYAAGRSRDKSGEVGTLGTLARGSLDRSFACVRSSRGSLDPSDRSFARSLDAMVHRICQELARIGRHVTLRHATLK